MTAFDSPMSLQSSGIADILMKSLWVRIGFAGISTFFSLIEVLIPAIYASLESLDGLVALIALIVNITTLILAVVWLHRYHKDLMQLYGDYPITPGGALARFMIPFYNIWGIWNTLTTVAGRFKGEEGVLHDLGASLQSLVPRLYGVAILSNILTRYTLQQSLRDPDSVPGFLWLITALVDLGLAYVLLQIAKVMIQAINTKFQSKQQPF
jgi:hypothetical protein